VLLELEEAVRGAEARESAEQRSADAIRMLDDLFDEARKQADQTLANAIESHIDPYLQCVFGEAASARIARDERDGYSIALYRPQQGAEDFKSLSGGTKEQLATAVRLATAEILAPAFDGCLPIVLDDAFTNTDPERVRKLASMLFLASDRGLQVIIGTCQPEDYVDVPGKTVSMRPPRTQVAPSAREAVREEPAASIDRRVLEVGVEPKSPSGASSSDCEAFLAALQGLGGSSGNKSLRESLSWNEARYDQVKEQLLEAQRISLGRGRGGSVSLRGPL
jgi:energy-coupling factor transporter ATP-binding protein EcfA2